MKRKVLGIGKTALGITLPSKWYQKNGLKKGDEINYDYSEGKLILFSDFTEKESRLAEINISGYTKRAIHTTIAAHYKKGFDQIKIRFQSDDELDYIIKEITRYYIGFIISEQAQEYVIFKKIAKEDDEEFDNTLRRAFFITINMADSLYDQLSKNNISGLKRLLSLEMANNQLTNFCERLLVRGIKQDNSCFYYVVVWNLEKICDLYRDLIIYIVEEKPKMDKAEQEALKKINLYLRNMFGFLYDFELKKIDLLKREKTVLKDTVSKLDYTQIRSFLVQLEARISECKTTMAAINLA